MSRGILNAYRMAAAVAVTNSTTPVTTTLQSPIAANQKQHLRVHLPFSTGAAGGIRLLVAVPAGGTGFRASYVLHNTGAPAVVNAMQVASGTAFTNAAANAANHFIEVEIDVENGVNAGVVDIQIAQNTADATPITALEGGWMEATII